MCPQIYRIGKALQIRDGKVIQNNASTIYDTTQKSITPMVLSLLKTIICTTKELSEIL